MIYYYDLKQRCIRKTATLFVMAVNSKIHLKVITKDFEDSVLIKQIENNDYTKIYDESIVIKDVSINGNTPVLCCFTLTGLILFLSIASSKIL